MFNTVKTTKKKRTKIKVPMSPLIAINIYLNGRVNDTINKKSFFVATLIYGAVNVNVKPMTPIFIDIFKQ